MSETTDTAAYVRGIRKAIMGLALPPIVLATLPMYCWLWGPALAVAHTVFWLLLAALLAEFLLLRFHKVPFTCSYVPGKANVKLLWSVYLFALTTYAYATAQLEVWQLADPGRWVVGCACLLPSSSDLQIWWVPRYTRLPIVGRGVSPPRSQLARSAWEHDPSPKKVRPRLKTSEQLRDPTLDVDRPSYPAGPSSGDAR